MSVMAVKLHVLFGMGRGRRCRGSLATELCLLCGMM